MPFLWYMKKEPMWMDINWKPHSCFLSLTFYRYCSFSHFLYLTVCAPHSLLCNKTHFLPLFLCCVSPIWSFNVVSLFSAIYLPDLSVPFLRYILHFNGSCFYSLTHSIIFYLFPSVRYFFSVPSRTTIKKCFECLFFVRFGRIKCCILGKIAQFWSITT